MRKKIILPFIALALCGLVGFTTVVKNDFFEIAKQLEIFTSLYKELNMNYVDKVTPATLMDNAIKGVLEDLDPYTVYWNEQAVEDARIKNSGVYTGVGASMNFKNKTLTVREVFENYPADNAGVRAGDVIIKIDQTDLKGYDEDPRELLKGAVGSKVVIQYKRQNKKYETIITRGPVKVNAVPYYTLINKNIGYIVLSKFNKKTTLQTKNALEDLKLQGATKIILDLRGNPGGLLNQAISVVNLFVEKGEVVTTTRSVIEKYNKVYKTTSEPLDTTIPLAVLINGRSASASEIVSGALQDLDRAVIIGARSFGKGLVQRPKNLTYGTQLKVTISRYYTPSGRCIQALDYWNRDENGDPVRVDPKKYNPFKTKGGRTVYDGGGILPDIELESAKFSPITTALLKENTIFNYATQYAYKNKMDRLEDFSFVEKDFQDFLKFLKSNDFNFKTQTELSFKKAFKKAEEDGFSKQIQSNYKEIISGITEAKKKKITNKKSEIIALLKNEILKQKFYSSGLYAYQVLNNLEIKEAIEVLENTTKYNNLLK